MEVMMWFNITNELRNHKLIYDSVARMGSVLVCGEAHYSPFGTAHTGVLLGRLISDTANEISDREEHPLTEASAKNNRNHNCNGGYAKFNKLPYKYMRAGYEHSKSCRRCDDDEGRTPNTGFAKGRDQYILQSGRELTLLKNTGEATGKRVDSKNISGSDRFTSGGTVSEAQNQRAVKTWL